jgi:hypothetical protein
VKSDAIRKAAISFSGSDRFNDWFVKLPRSVYSFVCVKYHERLRWNEWMNEWWMNDRWMNEWMIMESVARWRRLCWMWWFMFRWFICIAHMLYWLEWTVGFQKRRTFQSWCTARDSRNRRSLPRTSVRGHAAACHPCKQSNKHRFNFITKVSSFFRSFQCYVMLMLYRSPSSPKTFNLHVASVASEIERCW